MDEPHTSVDLPVPTSRSRLDFVKNEVKKAGSKLKATVSELGSEIVGKLPSAADNLAGKMEVLCIVKIDY